MAWNEPGGNGKDPWGNRQNDGPPDLDEVFRNLQKKLAGLFGSKPGGTGNGGNFAVSLGLILAIILIAWSLFGIYIIDEGERGVVLRFGKHIDTTQPGPHWYPPLVEKIIKVQVANVRQIKGNAQALTGDKNIVRIEYTVQYNVKDAADYVFNVDLPDQTLQQASESAFREVIGKNTFDFVTIGEGREEVSRLVEELLQQNLDFYGTGLEVVNANLNESQPPQEVQDAFNEAIKASADKERFIEEAQAYRNDILPKARGDAQEQIEQAMAYKFKVIESAEGEAQRFLKLLTEYERAPEVTRQRLYLETIETVLANSGKVVVDVEGGNNMMYLPLDKIINNQGRVSIEPLGNAQSGGGSSDSPTTGNGSTPSRGTR
ncbi:MAG: FtsH protease activity modulator HflK [Gammaproteobacteria bacterium]|nr:FtsH protease activity modulator HflK [Gammaproteobacteria bacterium]